MLVMRGSLENDDNLRNIKVICTRVKNKCCTLKFASHFSNKIGTNSKIRVHYNVFCDLLYRLYINGVYMQNVASQI